MPFLRCRGRERIRCYRPIAPWERRPGISHGRETPDTRPQAERFDKNKNSGYAFTLTDDGDLKFLKFNNIHQPADMTPLFSTAYKAAPGKDYELGIIAVGNAFYLFVNRKFQKMVSDDTFPGGINGLVAIGTGTHWFDNVSIYKPIGVD